MSNPDKPNFNPRSYGEALKGRIVNSTELGDKANRFDYELRDTIAERGKTPAVLKIASRAIAESMRIEEEAGDRESSPERYRFDVVARLGEYTDNSIKLEMLNKAKAKREEKEPYLLELADFNHVLQDMLRSDPDANLKDVQRFLTNMYIMTERPATDPKIWDSKLAYFEQHIQITLEGARNELVVADILQSMGVEYNTDVTPAEDIRGIDGYVNLHGSTFPIDVKSSPKAVMGARHTSHHATSIVWSCVSPEDFINNGCRISKEDMDAKHELMYQQLDQAYAARYTTAA